MILSEDSVATWIAFPSDNGPEAHKIKIFKTYKEAKKKLEFLKKKINQNGYMLHWELEIEEV